MDTSNGVPCPCVTRHTCRTTTLAWTCPTHGTHMLIHGGQITKSYNMSYMSNASKMSS